MLPLVSTFILILFAMPMCCGFQLFKFPFRSVKRVIQLNSLSEKICEVPEPYGKYRLLFKFVPETAFYVTKAESNYSDVVLTRKGLVCPILGWREKECRGEILDTAASLKYRMRDDDYRAYMIPEDTPVPDQLLFLQDTRLDRTQDYDCIYFLAPREACTKPEFEKLLVDFVMHKDRLCLSRYKNKRPKVGRNKQINATAHESRA